MTNLADPSRAWVYLDSASGQPLHPSARDAILSALDQGYADPRRLHDSGRRARLLLDNARAAVAQCLDVRPDEVSFTSSGTDAVHRGLLGLRRGRLRVGTTIAHSAVEHSAVLEAIRWADVRSIGFAVDRAGLVDLAAAQAALAAETEPVAVAAVQLANPEVGCVQPIEAIADALGNVPLFMDAAAATGTLPWPGGWQVAAASAHKWGGPAGVGVLVVRKGARWRDPFPADDRAEPRVSGFENVPSVLGAAAALQAVQAEHSELSRRHTQLSAQLRDELASIPDLELVSSARPEPGSALPGLVAFSCLYVDGEALVGGLDRRGFGVASGSACTSSALSPSHVLEAMGVLTQGNLRVSFGRDTQPDDVARFARALREVLDELRSGLGLDL